jgi:hypothetical protein
MPGSIFNQGGDNEFRLVEVPLYELSLRTAGIFGSLTIPLVRVFAHPREAHLPPIHRSELASQDRLTDRFTESHLMHPTPLEYSFAVLKLPLYSISPSG